MAVSGTYDFTPEIAELIDEAYERAGVDPSTLTGKHITSAIRSINLMFAHWATKGTKQWKVDRQTTSVVSGTSAYTMPAGSLDVVSLVYRQDGIDTPITRISRDEYLNIHDKDLTGAISDQYFVDRQRDLPVINLWPVPNNNNDSIIYDRLVRIQDAGEMSDDPDVPFYWYEAMVAGLAEKIALKYNPDKFNLLKVEALQAFKEANDEDRDRSPMQITVNYRGRV